MSLKIVFMFFCLFVCCFTKNLPSYIERCSLSDPKLRDCLIRSIENAVPSIINGDKNYKILSMVPVNIPFVEIQVGEGSKMKFIDTNFTCFKSMKIQDVDFDKETGKFLLKYVEQKLDASSNYEMDIKLFGTNIKGNGPSFINFGNAFVTYTTYLKPFTDKNGLEHYKVDNGKVTFNPKEATFDFQNLFDGNESLGGAMNRLFNENWKDLFGILQPTVENVLAGIMDNAFTNYLKWVPKNAIFLP
ncbi:protein takeout-like [Onthophagus taurus]|uniref:protein takeout-like n=1 Tax=Onthophagus taurus TaxID=166361 RepID=UPI0039BE20B1